MKISISKIKNVIISFICVFMFTGAVTFVNAKQYQKSKTQTAYTSVGNASVTCTATYDTNGATRWKASGTVSSSTLYRHVYFTIDYGKTNNTKMVATGHVTLTTAGGISGTGSTTFTAHFTGSSLYFD